MKAKTPGRGLVTSYIFSKKGLLSLCSIFLVWYLVTSNYVAEPEQWIALPNDVLATRIWATDIMSRPMASGQDLYTIPRYIHQSWMNDKLPSRMSRWSQSCRAHHRQWQWILWTDEDNLKLAETYFSWFLDTYQALPAEINRADASRNMYMYLFGGVYADLDTECLQPFDGLFNGHDVGVTHPTTPENGEQALRDTLEPQVAFFGRMGYDATDDTLSHTIPNAWMAASPGHPFFLYILERLQAAVEANQDDKYHTTAEDLTGPVALYHAVQEYNSIFDRRSSLEEYLADNPSYHLFDRPSPTHRIKILPPENIFPYSWNNQGIPYRKACWAKLKSYNSMKCKNLVATNQSYAITYWSHSWNEDLHQARNRQSIKAMGRGHQP